MGEFDARNTTGENLGTSRSQMSAEKTLQEIRDDGERKFNDLRKNNLDQYAIKSKALQKELNKMALDDAENLNYQKEKLEEKYTDMVRRGKLSLKQLELKIAKDLSKIAYK